MDNIRIGIVGYGNIGRGVEMAVRQNEDMVLAGVFTRRSPSLVTIKTKEVPVYELKDALSRKHDIDVMILCGGSAKDLPVQTPEFAKNFHVVDSFDTHAKIPSHFEAVNSAAKEGGKIGIISVGWDPGMFSINRLYANALLPKGSDNTFWGRGISQGHSDAIRRIEGVADAKQYTVPIEEAVDAVRSGKHPVLTARQKHKRDCYVVVKEGGDKAYIESQIKNMPHYFADYDTSVSFVSQEELNEKHSGCPHGGFVLRSGETGEDGMQHIIEYRLKLDSNPEFTANVMAAYARAAVRLAKEGVTGAKTVLDIPPSYLSPKSGEELRESLL